PPWGRARNSACTKLPSKLYDSAGKERDGTRGARGARWNTRAVDRDRRSCSSCSFPLRYDRPEAPMKSAVVLILAATAVFAQSKQAAKQPDMCAPPPSGTPPALPAKILTGQGTVHFPITT